MACVALLSEAHQSKLDLATTGAKLESERDLVMLKESELSELNMVEIVLKKLNDVATSTTCYGSS